ncbi:phosphate ABC transporter, periplasmic phosphate- binding protein, partial [mine drainage metagenome]
GLVASACGSSSSSSSNSSSVTTAAATTAAPSASTTTAPNFASGENPPTAKVAIQETGSTLLYPLFNLWAPDYQKQFPNITITTAGTGSGTGIADAASATVDIGASDAYLSSTQTTKSPTLVNIPLAISAQEIVYNIPGVTTQLDLSGSVISKIYQGKIQYWDTGIKALN